MLFLTILERRRVIRISALPTDRLSRRGAPECNSPVKKRRQATVTGSRTLTDPSASLRKANWLTGVWRPGLPPGPKQVRAASSETFLLALVPAGRAVARRVQREFQSLSFAERLSKTRFRRCRLTQV